MERVHGNDVTGGGNAHMSVGTYLQPTEKSSARGNISRCDVFLIIGMIDRWHCLKIIDRLTLIILVDIKNTFMLI